MDGGREGLDAVLHEAVDLVISFVIFVLLDFSFFFLVG